MYLVRHDLNHLVPEEPEEGLVEDLVCDATIARDVRGIVNQRLKADLVRLPRSWMRKWQIIGVEMRTTLQGSRKQPSRLGLQLLRLLPRLPLQLMKI